MIRADRPADSIIAPRVPRREFFNSLLGPLRVISGPIALALTTSAISQEGTLLEFLGAVSKAYRLTSSEKLFVQAQGTSSTRALQG